MHRSLFLRKLLLLDRRGAEGGRPPRGGTRTVRFLRPPGALMEPGFLAACTRCGDCIEACPHAVVTAAKDPRIGVDTPVVDPSLGVCDHCGACIEACRDGALLPGEDPRMGTAVFLESCLSLRSAECTACLRACPLSGEAVRIADEGGIEIAAESCDGCAACLHACPLDPPAVRIQGRPSVPMEGHPRVPARSGR